MGIEYAVLHEGTEKGRLVQDRAWRDRPGWRESQYSGRYAGIPDSEPVSAGGECDARAARCERQRIPQRADDDDRNSLGRDPDEHIHGSCLGLPSGERRGDAHRDRTVSGGSDHCVGRHVYRRVHQQWQQARHRQDGSGGHGHGQGDAQRQRAWQADAHAAKSRLQGGGRMGVRPREQDGEYEQQGAPDAQRRGCRRQGDAPRHPRGTGSDVRAGMRSRPVRRDLSGGGQGLPPAQPICAV